MDNKSLPFYKRLSFKFLFSTALFILLVEVLLLVLSLQGMETRLHSLREMILTNLPSSLNLSKNDILSTRQIYEIFEIYARNIVVMVFVIILVVVSGLYVVFNRLFLAPLKTIVRRNERTATGGTLDFIDEDEIPENEIGLIMKSRNEMLSTINTLYNEEAFETLREAVDAKDEYTEGHSQRVGKIGALLGDRLSLSGRECEKLEQSGLLHDVGKIAVSDSILTKSGPLTEEEFEEIRSHPARGEKIIQFSNIEDSIIEGVRHHHERFDGSGYPDGLKRARIPLFGRILAVADAMDAMLSERHYRGALSWKEVHRQLNQNKGQQFDPEIATVALDIIQPANPYRLPEFKTAIT